MTVFLLIILALPLADLIWWWRADRLLRPTRRSAIWRALLGCFAAFQICGFAWVIGSRFADVRWLAPSWFLAALYVWHLFVLPATSIAWLVWIVGRAIPRAVRLFQPAPASIDPQDSPAQASERAPSRRQFLATAAAAAPPVLLAAGLGYSLPRLSEFRINRITLPLAGLPRDLDGLTIAQVSDVHVGRFTRASMLPKIADATNALHADLVLMTGDLIDYSLADLPAATDMVRRLDPRHGLFTIEGNHDLFEGRAAFDRGVRAAGIPLLLNESTTVRIRGIDVQLLGIRWGNGDRGRGANYEEHMASVLPQLRAGDSGAFPILLAHHPHAFDLAVANRIPLTLSGHTHGGQLMLTRSIGPGSLMYKYWSGLYRNADSALFVSNGVGNWFPLRINAPAEIVHLTLRSA